MTAHPSVSGPRQATIDRAIALIDANMTDGIPSPKLAGCLAYTRLHDHMKANPVKLRAHLAEATPDNEDGATRHFNAWKAAQQLLQAAGLPY